jgi:hypothetical protein
MSEPYTGGCACGAIRYEISAEPVVMNDCQCRDCQRKSGTGHGSYLTFPRMAVKLRGEAKHWDIVGDSGNVKTRAFCPACGSPVYMTFAARPDRFTVHAASLDDPSRYKPQMVMYGVRGYAWDHVDSSPAEIRQIAAEVKCRLTWLRMKCESPGTTEPQCRKVHHGSAGWRVVDAS